MTNLRYHGGERESNPKRVRWIASSRDDVSELPEDVKAEVGQTLWKIQCGDTPVNTKAMHAKLQDVREIIVDDDGETYRAMYTIKLGDYVYVLAAFKKKANRGIATPQKDIDRVERRLKIAREHYEKNP